MNEQRGFEAIRSMDYVIVLCDDLNKMKRFYSGLFGFHVQDDEPGWIGYRVGTLIFGLRPRGRPYDGPQIADESASIQLSFRVPPADVDIAYQTLKDEGIDVIEEPKNQHWPHRTLFFRDPENNVIEIFADIHTSDTPSYASPVHGFAHRQK